MDGNTRLCTATSAFALKETFGSDGQPGSYTDLDATDAILHVGHNIASQQTVLWMRILDRRRGPNPPKLIVIDPRMTETAREADIHLAPRLGTNVPLINGLIHRIIQAGHIDRDYIEAHTSGFDELAATVRQWTPERVEEVTGVPSGLLCAAAKVLGETKSLVSTALQGVYQSMQATAAACQINNLHLIRGLLGCPGSGIYQMNGQPTAQNTRETGADGDLPAFRNWDNPEHIEELARLWNIDASVIPHWAPPTHAMQIFRYAETGSIKLLWISATNPAVSMPELRRVREILGKPDLFIVVQDAFRTETAEMADLVLPAAIWGEKTGCFTNVDRTVHLSLKAVEPPGEARSDLEIFLDYARRMDCRDKDGAPLIKWSTPEGAFEAWKECTRGRPCDYSGMTYAQLERGPIQWPCNEQYPEGRERLYEDGIFNTDASTCETYGHDLITGGAVRPERYKASDPKGRALIKPADYLPPHEVPDADYPYWLTTGRLVYHFHTRTKTGRSARLNDAAPDAFIQLAARRQRIDAHRVGLGEQAAAFQICCSEHCEGLSRDRGRGPGRRHGPWGGLGHQGGPGGGQFGSKDHHGQDARGQLSRSCPGQRGSPGRVTPHRRRPPRPRARRFPDDSAPGRLVRAEHRGAGAADFTLSRDEGERARQDSERIVPRSSRR
jgi:anaerobic selenocysteine-containing dehydrogenase